MDILKAVLLAFVPIAGLTFVIAYYSYKNGIVSIRDDKRDEWDIAGKNKDDDWGGSGESSDDALHEDRPTNNYLHQKWISFGGGFYGLIALVTFCVIEAKEVVGFILSIEGWQTILDLLNLDTLISLFIASIMNMVDAFIWFKYWPDQIDMGNGWIWLGMAYGGYHFGRWLAEFFLSRSNKS